MGIEVDNEYRIEFIRRTLVNDTETIDNIVKSAMDLDLRTRLELNPLVDNKKIDEIMLRLEEESQDRFDKEVVEVV